VEFRRLHPDVKIAVQGSRNHQESSVLPLTQAFIDGLANSRRGDGKISGHLGSNDVQLLASSRPLTGEEIKQFRQRHGYEPTAVLIAQDAVALYVNKNNPITGLTLEQIDAIFSKTRKRGSQEDLRTWGQLGLPDEWQQGLIRAYGRDARSTGTLPFFKHVVLLDGEFKNHVQAQPGSASIVLAVAGDPFGIGYSGIGFQTSSVRPVSIAEKAGAPFVAPSADMVMNGSYPLSRPLYLYVNKDPNKDLDPKILEFLKFANSREGQETIIQAGVYPLTSVQIARNLSILGIGVQAASIQNASTIKQD
jgi:phosphate transport system substrate-binding protein